jgi:hypothetical protein
LEPRALIPLLAFMSLVIVVGIFFYMHLAQKNLILKHRYESKVIASKSPNQPSFILSKEAGYYLQLVLGIASIHFLITLLVAQVSAFVSDDLIKIMLLIIYYTLLTPSLFLNSILVILLRNAEYSSILAGFYSLINFIFIPFSSFFYGIAG